MQSKLNNLQYLSQMKLRSRAQREKKFNKTKSAKSINYLWIVFFVKRFVDTLKMKTLQSKMKKLENLHYNLFDDAALFPKESKNNIYNIKNPIFNRFVKFFFFNVIFL